LLLLQFLLLFPFFACCGLPFLCFFDVGKTDLCLGRRGGRRMGKRGKGKKEIPDYTGGNGAIDDDEMVREVLEGEDGEEGETKV
jgi:hypothetical protein